MTFRDGSIDVNGITLRYRESGQGTTLLHVLGESRTLTPAHDLLARHFRVLAVDLPAAVSVAALTTTMAQAIETLDAEAVDLMGSSSGGAAALWLALEAPTRVRALVLDTPAPGPEHEPALARRLPDLATPTLVVCGSRDSAAAQEAARSWEARLPNGHLVFVYDAAPPLGAARPEAFAEVVSDFLERREAFVISRAATVIHP